MSGSPDYTLTPNLGLFLPNYDMDDGLWGTHLNQNAQILDAVLGPSATPFLPISGGTLTGLLVVPRVNISNIPQAKPDGSPPDGSIKGDLYNNGGYVCIAP